MIFTPSEILAKSLQGKNATASMAMKSSKELVTLLQSKRTDLAVDTFICSVQKMSQELDLKQPLATSRYESEPTVSECVPLEWKRQYFEAIDLTIEELQRRFDQKDMKVAAAREDLLLNACNGHSFLLTTSSLPGNLYNFIYTIIQNCENRS